MHHLIQGKLYHPFTNLHGHLQLHQRTDRRLPFGKFRQMCVQRTHGSKLCYHAEVTRFRLGGDGEESKEVGMKAQSLECLHLPLELLSSSSSSTVSDLKDGNISVSTRLLPLTMEHSLERTRVEILHNVEDSKVYPWNGIGLLHDVVVIPSLVQSRLRHQLTK